MEQTDTHPNLDQAFERIQVEEPDMYAEILRNFDEFFARLVGKQV